jgi:hypothetical protein
LIYTKVTFADIEKIERLIKGGASTYLFLQKKYNITKKFQTMRRMKDIFQVIYPAILKGQNREFR